MKIYTKAGDAGQTGLVDGSRVAKDDLRVAAYGDVDELSALLGVVRSNSKSKDLDTLLRQVQRDLFAIGAQLADPRAIIGKKKVKAAVTATQVRRLEKAIDLRQSRMPKLRHFILPGGSKVGALLHVARTACRRAERAAVALTRRDPIDPRVMVYLNRLSDLLFVVARYENHKLGEPEDIW